MHNSSWPLTAVEALPPYNLDRLITFAGVLLVGLTICGTSAGAQALHTLTPAESIQAIRAKGLWPDKAALKAPGDSAPVLFSFSGGISLGSYQAGVNWVMVEFLKATRHPDPKTSDLDKAIVTSETPRIPVAAMTGASAGNINVLLAAIEYCDSTRVARADQSLFWDMWVKTGWDELFPDGKRSEPGVLDRSVAMERVQDRVITDMAYRNTFMTGCNVPLGVVTTKVRASSIPLDKNLTYDTQRYVALFEAQEAGHKLQLIRARPALIKDAAAGTQMVLQSGPGGVLDPREVFKVIKASSSYPIAFSPVTIEYQSPQCATSPGCSSKEVAEFLDGGVFDNNPIGLVVNLRDFIPFTGKTRVLFVDPGAALDGTRLKTKQDDLRIRSQAKEHDDPNGVGGLLTFVGGFVPSARQYELQSFARSQAGLQAADQAVVRSSTRTRNVIGEHLNAFAAFLGEPFREFDFYVGVADGIRFVSSEILCTDERPWRLDPNLKSRIPQTTKDPGLRQAAASECAETQTTQLARSAFNLDQVGRHVVEKALHHAYPAIAISPTAGLPAQDRARASVLDALEEATYVETETPLKAENACDRGPFLQRVICADGFDVALANLREHREAMTILQCTDRHPTESTALLLGIRRKCNGVTRYPVSIEASARLAMRPQETLDTYLTRALQVMRRTEKDEETHKREDNWSAKMKIAEYVYRSADDVDGWKLDQGPSSIPENDGWRSVVASALPYFAGPTAGGPGFQIGWQSELHTAFGGLEAVFPLGTVRLPRRIGVRSDGATSAFATPSVGYSFQNPYVNQISIGGRFETRGRMESLGIPHAVAEFGGLFLGGKLRADLYRVPADRTAFDKGRWMGGLSLVDVNGLFYWFLLR